LFTTQISLLPASSLTKAILPSTGDQAASPWLVPD